LFGDGRQRDELNSNSKVWGASKPCLILCL
jgi:hypothetical protein